MRSATYEHADSEVIFHTAIVLFLYVQPELKLALIPTLAMLITGSIAILEERRLGDIYEDISEENAALNTVAEENLAGVRTVKAFARKNTEIGKFLSHNNRYYELNMRQSKVFVKYSSVFSLITAAAAHLCCSSAEALLSTAGSPSAA